MYYVIAVMTMKMKFLIIIISPCDYNHKYQTLFSQCSISKLFCKNVQVIYLSKY